MRVLHESADELAILSPARGARTIAIILLAVGLLIGIPIGIPLLRAGIASLAEPPTEPVWGLPAPLVLIIPGVLLFLPALGGLVALFRTRETEYHFLGSRRTLVARDRRRELQVIPFSEIIKAVAYTNSGHDEPDTFGLRLKLRGFLRSLQISQLDRSGEHWGRHLSELAERINRFLEAHAGEPSQTSPKDLPQGIAKLEPGTVSPEDRRSKLCPRCGRTLTVYAVTCRFCKANLD
jgi:hypothetical protein